MNTREHLLALRPDAHCVSWNEGEYIHTYVYDKYYNHLLYFVKNLTHYFCIKQAIYQLVTHLFSYLLTIRYFLNKSFMQNIQIVFKPEKNGGICRSHIPPQTYSFFLYNCSHCCIHSALTASDGIRQSPRGDKVTVPTFGPSGRQERLNCCVKNRRTNVVSHFFIVSLSYTPAKARCAMRKIFFGSMPNRSR